MKTLFSKLKNNYLTFSGRVCNKTFNRRFMLLFIMNFVLGSASMIELSSCRTEQTILHRILLLVLTAVMFLSYVAMFSLVVRRSHDYNLSGKRFILYMLIPLWNLFQFLNLFYLEGDAAENEYGLPPAK